MIIKVLDRASIGYDIPIEDKLSSFGEVICYDSTASDDILSRVWDADVIVLNKVKINEEIINALPRLKLICEFATGYDNIDVRACAEHGVAVCNVPAYSTESVALFTVANVLFLMTHLNQYRSYVSSGEYTKSDRANCLEPTFNELYGKTWGIVGYGNIGKRVGEIAKAFGANVIVNKRSPVPGVECVDINELCRRSDIVTVHCPLNDATRGLIGKEQLCLIGKNGILVNEARGAVIDEDAVAYAIENGVIGAFGSDVYSNEPFGEDHPFFRIKHLNNVCLTPHAAWGAIEARSRCLDIVCNNISSFFDGKILNRVDKI